MLLTKLNEDCIDEMYQDDCEMIVELPVALYRAYLSRDVTNIYMHMSNFK